MIGRKGEGEGRSSRRRDHLIWRVHRQIFKNEDVDETDVGDRKGESEYATSGVEWK
jgi:hypothetical protein